MSLSCWGYSAFFHDALEALGEPSLVPARVLRGEPAPIRVQVAAGDALASLAGRLRESEPAATIVAGDWVAFDERHHVVRHTLPRRTAFVRRAAGGASRPQVVAANFDIAFVVMGLDHDFNLHRLERYLALTHASGATPVVLLTKAAVATARDRLVREAEAVARSIPVYAIDVIAGMSTDVPRQYLGEGVTAVLLGSSGVGKSTLLNHLLGHELARTAPTRAGDDKGRHTTTRRELFQVPGGGCIIDTPGMRELGLWCDGDALRAAFDDVASFAAQCHFRDCSHRDEPGCAVRHAVDGGLLDRSRAESFHRLDQEMERARAQRQKWERRAKERVGSRMVREAKRHKYGRDG
ncbi:MAG TPA: ribosome small subunit-dependent GTPase A [Polyangiaceae bacterium]|nr:ribosome small subunit-dependent GTPase A [Polyangiaceae bacterium]